MQVAPPTLPGTWQPILSRHPRALLQRRALEFVLPALGLLALAVALRLPFLSWPITEDEGGYAYGAYWWSRGIPMYSGDLWFDRPQGIFWAYQSAFALFGETIEAARLWSALWAGGTAIGCWLLGRALFDARTGVVAGVLCALASASVSVEGHIANAELFMLLPATFACLALHRGQYATAGALTGLAIVLKPSGAGVALTAAAWLLYSRAAWPEWARYAAAAAVVLGAALAHGVATAGLDGYLEASVLFRLEHPVADRIGQFRAGWLLTAPVWAPPALGALVSVRRVDGRGRAFLAAWVAGALAGCALGGNWFQHYFLQLVPVLAVAASPSVAGLRLRRPMPVVLALVLAVVLLAPTYGDLRAGGVLATTRFKEREGLLLRQDEVARYIRAHTAPEDRVAIVHPEPAVSFLTQRLGVSPLLYRHPLREVHGAYEALLASIEAGEPRVVAIHDRRWPELDLGRAEAALGVRYDLVLEYPDARVYLRRD